jgi:hypothetical protein
MEVALSLTIKVEDSNISDVCTNLLDRTYYLGVPLNAQHEKHVKARHRLLNKRGLTRRGIKGLQKQSSIWDVVVANQKRYKFLRALFKNKSNKELSQIIKYLAKTIEGKISIERSDRLIQNKLVASVINPINRREYGSNSLPTIRRKGFDFVMKDTGQMASKIKAWRID